MKPFGAKIQYHLLETNRVYAKGVHESNFHVFYAIIFGASTELLQGILLDSSIPYQVS